MSKKGGRENRQNPFAAPEPGLEDTKISVAPEPDREDRKISVDTEPGRDNGSTGGKSGKAGAFGKWKKDILLLVILLAAFLILFAVFRAAHTKPGGTVEVKVDGAVYGTWPLNQEQKIEIKKEGRITNVLTIRDGYADMTEADCPDLLCVHQRRIHAKGETIVCLPNRVVVNIADGEEGEMDAVVS